MTDKRHLYGYCLTFSEEVPEGEWRIYKGSFVDAMAGKNIIARFPNDEEWNREGPPPRVRAEYERIIKYNPAAGNPPSVNVVELLAGDASFDQPCRYGGLVDGHAVYCHNDSWLYAPRKCRRSWHTNGEVRDEDCEGYAPQHGDRAQKVG